MKKTIQIETDPSVYATVYPVNRPSDGTDPSGNTIYADVEMTQQLTPSSNTIYASIQPTSEPIDMGNSAEYADLDLPRSHEQKPRSAEKINACLSPNYLQPFEPPSTASNAVYAEPFKPDKTPTVTTPVKINNGTGDQQNSYAFAKAIPLAYPNVIYSEPNKSAKPTSPTVTGEGVRATDPIYLEAIEVKHGD